MSQLGQPRGVFLSRHQPWPHLTTFFYTNTTLETLFTVFLAVNIVLPFLFFVIYVKATTRGVGGIAINLPQEIQGEGSKETKKA